MHIVEVYMVGFESSEKVEAIQTQHFDFFLFYVDFKCDKMSIDRILDYEALVSAAFYLRNLLF